MRPIISNEKHREFEALVKPLMRWLWENHHPHITVVLDSHHAEVLEGQYTVIVKHQEYEDAGFSSEYLAEQADLHKDAAS